MKNGKTEKQELQEAIGTAVSFLTPKQRKEVLTFINILPHEYAAAINESVKGLTIQQMKKVLEFIALMPGEGKGEIHPEQTSL
jgi:hypothetical protein